MSAEATYRPTFISFAPSYACNLACAHCCVPSGSGDRLGSPVAVDCVREAPTLGITAVGFTGGEPMLVCEWVAEVVRAAREAGLEADDLSTNGVWWSEREEMESALELLRGAGLEGGFHLSVDAFHAGAGGQKQAEFVHACLEAYGTAGNLSCAEGPTHPALPAVRRLSGRLGADVVEESDEAGRLVLPHCEIPYSRFLVADVGQSSGVGVSTGCQWFGEFDCYGHDTILVDPSGEAHFCLGFASYAARPLWLGSVAQDGLSEVVLRAAENPLVRLLCSEGPAGLRRVILERNPGAFEESWASPCAFCYHCLTDKILCSILHEAGILPSNDRA